MAETNTTISNMALSRIAVKTIDDFDDSTEVSQAAVQSRLHLPQTRRALLRSYDWPFAVKRLSLTEHTASPLFEWDNQFNMPGDYLRLTNDYTVAESNLINDRWTIEGRFLLTNETEASLVYIGDVENPDDWDSLFVEMQVLSMSIKMIYPLAGTSRLTAGLRKEIKDELAAAVLKAKAVALNEIGPTGRSDWNLARFTGTVTV